MHAHSEIKLYNTPQELCEYCDVHKDVLRFLHKDNINFLFNIYSEKDLRNILANGIIGQKTTILRHGDELWHAILEQRKIRDDRGISYSIFGFSNEDILKMLPAKTTTEFATRYKITHLLEHFSDYSLDLLIKLLTPGATFGSFRDRFDLISRDDRILLYFSILNEKRILEICAKKTIEASNSTSSSSSTRLISATFTVKEEMKTSPPVILAENKSSDTSVQPAVAPTATPITHTSQRTIGEEIKNKPIESIVVPSEGPPGGPRLI